MQLPSLTTAILIKRYKRFLADVTLEDGTEITVHCPNTGAMTGCAEAGSRLWLSRSDNPKRKYPHSWELVQTLSEDMVCIHSAKANALVKEGIENGVIPELKGYQRILTEVKYGEENSRIDLLLRAVGRRDCFVEVKSVTLLSTSGLGLFPDAVSERGRKHLRELMAMVDQGQRAVLLFCVQHTGINRVAPADSIDAAYGQLLREAMAAGVEVLAYGAAISEQAIVLNVSLPVLGRQPEV